MSIKKKIFIAVLAAEGVMIAVFIVLICYFSSSAVKVNRQMEFAQRYLLDEDYKRAIAAFDRIIEMDSDNVEAYIGIAEAYAETGALEMTVEILEEGVRRVRGSGSDEIEAVLDRYKEELAQIEASQEADSELAEALQPEPTEAEVDSDMQPEAAAVVNTGFITQDGDVYYYDQLGSLVVGWFEVDGSRYYAGADGKLYRNGEYEVDSVKYLFGQEGICVEEVRDEAWKQAYIDYFQILYEEYQEYSVIDFDLLNNGMYDLIFVDDDDIPEIYALLSGGPRGSAIILHYSNGVVDEFPAGDANGFMYVERKNVFSYDEGNLTMVDGVRGIIAMIGDGEIIPMVEYSINCKENGDELVYNVNGIEMSEEEFDKDFFKASFGEEEVRGTDCHYKY